MPHVPLEKVRGGIIRTRAEDRKRRVRSEGVAPDKKGGERCVAKKNSQLRKERVGEKGNSCWQVKT